MDRQPLTVEFSQVKSILGSIDWSFSTPFSVGRSGLELFDARKHHSYPATFVPEIPYTLIELLSRPSAVVYDPFSGIGTTVFQSLFLGRIPYGAEICRIAIGFMKNMWTLLRPDIDISPIDDLIDRINECYSPDIDYSGRLEGHPAQVDELRPWYAPETFNQLLYLASCQNECIDPASHAAIGITLSATLKSASAQGRGWGCISDNMLPKQEQLTKKKDAIKQIARRLGILKRDVAQARDSLPPGSTEFLIHADVDSHILRTDVSQSTIVADDSVDLIITSPPYANMTDYSLSQRLSYYWTGLDPMEDLPCEIGARRKRSRSSSIQDYTEAMKTVATEVSKSLKIGGYFCLVMPIFSGTRYNNTQRQRSIEEFIGSLPRHGLVREHVITRILPTGRRHHNQTWISLTKEEVSIFRKVN